MANFRCPVCGKPVEMHDGRFDPDNDYDDACWIHCYDKSPLWVRHNERLGDPSTGGDILDGSYGSLLAVETDPPINNFGDTE